MEDKSYVRVTAHGVISFKYDDPARTDDVKEALAYNINNFLIDLTDAVNKSDLLTQHQYAYEDFKRLGVDIKSKIALLIKDGEHSHDFIETVLINAGYTCKRFNNEQDAINWLAND